MTCDCHSYNWGTGEKPEVILTPPKDLGLVGSNGSPKKTICVDACIAHVIQHLWLNGVITLNCCCGHGKLKPSIIFEDSLTTEKADTIRKIIKEVDSREFEILSWKLVGVGVEQTVDESEIGELVDRRDYWEEKATELANDIGHALGFDVGEHSNLNCPVQNAIDGVYEMSSQIEEWKIQPPAVPGWIRVEDDLPKIGVEVNGVLKNPITGRCIQRPVTRVKEDDHDWESDGFEISHCWTVTHWMCQPPLPQDQER